MGHQISGVCAIALDALLVLPDFLGQVFGNLVLQGVFLRQIAGLEQPQPLDVNVQIHTLLDERISGAERLDFRIGQGRLVNVLSGADGRFAGHDLTNELLLALHQLIEVGIKGIFRHIGVNLHFWILVALPDDSALPLLQVGGTPRTIQVVQGDEPLLDVGARAHFGGTANQDTHLTGADFSEQFFLLSFSLGAVDVGDFLGGDSHGNQLIPEGVVDVELAVALRRRQVAEHQLRGFLCRRALPDGIDIPGTGADFSGLAGREHGIHHPLVQRQLTPVVGDTQHIVHTGVYHLIADFLGPLRQCSNHLFLVLGRL